MRYENNKPVASLPIHDVYIGVEWEPNVLRLDYKTGKVSALEFRSFYRSAIVYWDHHRFWRIPYKPHHYLNVAGGQIEVRSHPVPLLRFGQALRRVNQMFQEFGSCVAQQTDSRLCRIAMTSRKTFVAKGRCYKHVNLSYSSRWTDTKFDNLAWDSDYEQNRLRFFIIDRAESHGGQWRWHVKVPYLFTDYATLADAYVRLMEALQQHDFATAEAIEREVANTQNHEDVRIYGYTSNRQWITCFPLF